MTRGLVNHESSLTAIESALSDATTDIGNHLTTLLDTASAQMPAWTEETPSRVAQREHEQQLRDGFTRLTEALESVRAAVAAHRERTHEAEVENVAIVG